MSGLFCGRPKDAKFETRRTPVSGEVGSCERVHGWCQKPCVFHELLIDDPSGCLLSPF